MDGGANNHNREQRPTPSSSSIHLVHKRRLPDATIRLGVDVDHLRKLELRRLKRKSKKAKSNGLYQQHHQVSYLPQNGTSSGYLFLWRDPSVCVYTCCKCKQFFPDQDSLVEHKYCSEHVVFVHQPGGGIIETSTTRFVQPQTVPGHDQGTSALQPVVVHRIPAKRIKFTMVTFSQAETPSSPNTS